VVNITDDIPSGVTYIDNTVNAELNDGTKIEGATVVTTQKGEQVKLEAYTLAAGKTLTITFDVKVDTLPEGVYNNNIANNIAVVNGQEVPDDGEYQIQKSQIESSKSVDKETAEYGEELLYTIKAKNISTVKSEISINDPIPEGTEYVPNSITINGNATTDNLNFKDNKVIYNGILEEQNETVTITFKVKVIEEEIGTIITNKANINKEEKNATTKVIKNISVSTGVTRVNPIDLVLVLDVSGSMNDNGRLSDLKSSANKLVNNVFKNKTTSTISVITYSNTAKFINKYNYEQKENLINAIGKLKADGGTNIYAGLNKTNEIVSSLGTEREKVVVFLTDGSPTSPSDRYISGIYSDNNYGSGYENNVKDSIIAEADKLINTNKIKKVYSIGLGVSSLSDSEISYAEECKDTISLNKNIEFDTTNHTFTITLSNDNNTDIILSQVKATFDDINSIISSDNNGTISGKTMFSNANVIWNDITIPSNEDVVLSGTYEPSTERVWGGGTREKDPKAELSINPSKICITEGHSEELYSQTKTTRDGKMYHCATTQDYAKYILNNISSDKEMMSVEKVSTAFDKILEDISSNNEIYTLDNGNVIEIPENHEIITYVTLKIGDNTTTHTLEQLKSGVYGLQYINGEGFKWTISNDLATKKLSLEYKIKE